MDLLATALHHAPPLKGRGRLLSRWAHRQAGWRHKTLPGGFRLDLDMTIPYEAMVWIGEEERGELAMLRRLLKEGDVFIDCGANIGLWSVHAAPLVGDMGQVIAIEPNPATALRLGKHTTGSSVITVVNAAAGARPGVTRFDVGSTHNVAKISDRGTVLVDVITIDDIAHNTVTGLKIDVEGHELAVLQGSDNVLRQQPWLVVEFNIETSGAERLGRWDVHRFLGDRGYTAKSIRGRALDDDWGPNRTYANVLYRVPR